MTPTPLLSIRDLSVSFSTPAGQVTAVNRVSIELAAGQTLAVVGESGSGKSTTAAAINRLLPANGSITSGSIVFAGRDLATADERELIRIRGSQVGLIPQDPMSNLNPMQRIGTQIAEALEVHGRTSGKETDRRVVELLEMVGIPEPERRATQHPHEFSGGMRQRALIAMGLACEPALLIADEPTSALDVTVQRKILDQLERLTARMGTAVFLITHDLGLAAERADTVVVMYRGEIVESGEAREILENPQHEYTRALIAAAPSLTSRRLAAPLASVTGVAEAHAGAGPSGSGPAPLVEVENLTKEFDVRAGRSGKRSRFTAVDAVSFGIPRQQTVSIVGESGSGKSTTANMLLGLEQATSGSIRFDGDQLIGMRRRQLLAFRRRVQPVFQNPYSSLDPRYTVRRSIAEPLQVHGIGDARSRRARVNELLEQVALPPAMAERLPHELSGGQRQRVAIARALALSPELVILDEAVSALDVIVQNQILELLAGLQERLGLSYLLISHDLAVVRMLSHQVHVMQRGRIVESGTPDEIFDRPQEDYTRELLAAIPGERRVA
ncbi:ABC transporter ATP-binding protein [Phytoactinopolyspora alkaliphila]|uniref:ABC transporter ATP-binding protein n=1 Tax=Phytoactinopolyspora alkaliphila TaxID=1783498 RepID=A0A6N9YP37_9ACTN|nr:ABC transporter ATP-binding protein [Phytoactinopolyspora alkaliphila]NED96806.1 ABC transporter ATP-binding protein [Phytoactinopolyspora alkaliphila]